jgi:DNA-binding IclR family transcriptional regulator
VTILAPFGPTDSALLRAMILRANQGPSEAQIEAAPAQLVAYLATPKTLEELYPWGARRFFRPRMVRGLVRQLLDAGQIVTDGNPANPADWAWLWAATAAPPAPGARPDQERLDKLTPPMQPIEWNQHHVEPDHAAAAPAVNLAGGLQDTFAVPLEKIGKVLGVTKERVRQIELKALAKIRERAPELFNHLTGGTVPRIRAALPPPPAPEPEASPDPEPLPEPIPDPETPGDPVSKDLPDDDATPAPEYGCLRARILGYLADHPEGARACEVALAVSASQGSVRTCLDRAVRAGHASKVDGEFSPTATTRAAADAPAQRRPPTPAEGIRRRAEKVRGQILDALARAPGPVRANAIKDQIDATTSSFFRAITSLVKAGAIVSPKHGRYSLPDKALAPAPALAPLRLAPPPVEQPAPVARLPEPRRNASVTPPPAGDRLAAARAAVAALSPEELDALMASLAPVVEARKALAAALAGLRGAA